MLVRSYIHGGAALTVLGRGADGGLTILSETPPIGLAHRWLNPVARVVIKVGRERDDD